MEASLTGRMLHVKGKLGSAHKSFRKIPVGIRIDGSSVVLKAEGTRKRDLAILNTARSIVRNLCEGVGVGYTIKLKVVYAHFPITIKQDGAMILVENFQGERSARKAKIVGGTKVVSKGEDVIVTGHVLTDVSQTAANLEQGTKVKNKDHRVFLDGVYVYEKKKGE
ncbi:ribosomal protein L6P/L9E [Cenarchaeum symbiosum A]|uniref:50S ribosomal protein L6 n=1 Tax=Cenarchaeum symbiosum (strain A) TaxID=414004 RepID=A0RVY9_CENSY|nr:ribosomal protein L6P/L9E [Cenarchaeum symbiosum A]